MEFAPHVVVICIRDWPVDRTGRRGRSSAATRRWQTKRRWSVRCRSEKIAVATDIWSVESESHVVKLGVALSMTDAGHLCRVVALFIALHSIRALIQGVESRSPSRRSRDWQRESRSGRWCRRRSGRRSSRSWRRRGVRFRSVEDIGLCAGSARTGLVAGVEAGSAVESGCRE